MDTWKNLAEAYDSSFGRLCAGTTDAVLQAHGHGNPPPLRRRLLDVGSGTGTFAVAAAAGGFDVEGVDQEASMVAFSTRRVPGLRFRVGALPSLPYDDGTFDAVTANFVINHVARPAPGARLPPEQDFERSGTGLASLPEANGLADVTASRINWTFSITPEELWSGVEAGIAVSGLERQATLFS
jgi:SAM-dependent methyltransferase